MSHVEKGSIEHLMEETEGRRMRKWRLLEPMSEDREGEPTA